MDMFSVDTEYDCDAKLRKQDVKSLMVWLETQQHLPRLSEAEVLLFLKSCYYNNEFAKTTLDTYYTLRTTECELFHSIPNDLIKEYFKQGVCAPLSRKTPGGDSVFFLSLLDPNPANFDIVECFKVTDSVMTLELHKNGPHDGLQVVVDMKNFSLSHLPKLNLMIMKKSLVYIQEAVPVRLKGIHCINVNKTFMDILLSIIKPFMSKELINMLHMHNSIEDVTKFVPLECLPEDFGGQELSADRLREKVMNDVIQNRKFYEYQDKLLVDESKRPKDSKNSPEIFGVSGTFKKLELD